MWKTLVLSVALVGLCAVPAVFAEEKKAARESSKDTGAEPLVYKSSDLVGLGVRNRKGDDLGAIHDFVVNTKDGRVVYAVVSYGGTIGFGSKLFAVPHQALSLKAGDKNYTWDVDKEMIDRTDGFDANRWPTEADVRWNRFNKTGTPASPDAKKPEARKDEARKDEARKDEARKDEARKDEARKEEVRKEEVRKEDAKKDGEKGHRAAGANAIRRLSSMVGMTVKTPKGETLGRIYDLPIDVNNHRIAYAVMHYGSTLGVGGKLFAVPGSALEIQSLQLKPGSVDFVLNADKSWFETHPGFDSTRWPQRADDTIGKPAAPTK